MEIIATGELPEFLQNNLPKFEDPIIFISSDFIPGCHKCNSSTSVYYIKLTERSFIPSESNLQKAQNHKFPIDVYVNYPAQYSNDKTDSSFLQLSNYFSQILCIPNLDYFIPHTKNLTFNLNNIN